MNYNIFIMKNILEFAAQGGAGIWKKKFEKILFEKIPSQRKKIRKYSFYKKKIKKKKYFQKNHSIIKP